MWYSVNRNFDGGGVNIVYATNSSLMEIFGDEEATVPEVAPLQTGKLSDKQRTFNLFCTGRCQTNDKPLSLDMVGHKIPDLFTLNENGDIIIAPPAPMITATMPKGHNAWVKVTLSSMLGENKTDEVVKNWICLGIRWKGASDYIDVLHMAKMETRFPMFSENVVELVPLISAQNLSDGYLATTPGEKISEYPNIPQDGNNINFSTVYMVHTKMDAWIEEVSVDLLGNDWRNYGSLGIGKIAGQEEEQLVSVRSDGSLVYSADGVNWSECESEAEPDTMIFNKVAHETPERKSFYVINWDGDQFMAITGGYVDLYVSPNGVEWSKKVRIHREGTTDELYVLMYSNGYYVCSTWNGGYIRRSSDLTNWEEIGNNGTRFIMSGCSLPDQAILVNETGILTRSTNGGANWTSMGQKLAALYTTAGEIIQTICYGNNKLVAFTGSGWLSESTNEGNDWSTPEQRLKSLYEKSGNSPIVQSNFGNGKFMVMTENCWIAKSSDCINWSNMKQLATGITARGIAHGKNVGWCIVTYDGDFYLASEAAFDSYVNLERDDDLSENNDTNYWFASPKYGNGVWCAVNSGREMIRRSTDGASTWTAVAATISADCLEFNGEVFMTVDWRNGKVYSSAYANVWNEIGKIDTAKPCRILIYGDSKWLAGDEDGNLFQSTDGKGDWTSITTANLKTVAEGKFYGGCFANGGFYVVSNASDNSTSAVLKSIDCVKWTKIFDGLNSEYGFFNITCFKGKLYAYDRAGMHYIGLP